MSTPKCRGISTGWERMSGDCESWCKPRDMRTRTRGWHGEVATMYWYDTGVRSLMSGVVVLATDQ